MRSTFIRTLTELAAQDSRIVLLTGDLGYTVLEPFKEAHPTRFFNVGVAEQNMVGMAAGLAEGGFLPFVYSIATFASLRGYEFFRNSAIKQHLPVRVVAIGGGFEYGTAGLSHHALEDLAVMRVQPGLEVIAPADYAQTRAALLETYDSPRPVYYRLGKDEKNTLTGLDGRFSLTRPFLLGEGRDLLIVTTGAISLEAWAALEVLQQAGIHASLAVVASLSSALDLSEALAEFPVALSVEEHYITGGLGSLVAETIAEYGLAVRLVRCGVRDAPDGISGSQAFLRARNGLDAAGIAQAGIKAVRQRSVHV